MIEIQGDVYTFGGLVGTSVFGASLQKAIYKLSCFNLECEWSTTKQELKTARKNLVAIPVPDNLCT